MGEDFEQIAVILSIVASGIAILSFVFRNFRVVALVILIGFGLFASYAALMMAQENRDPSEPAVFAAGSFLLALLVAAATKRRAPSQAPGRPAAVEHKAYECVKCGYELDFRHFHCPQCGAAGSFRPNPYFDASSPRGRRGFWANALFLIVFAAIIGGALFVLTAR